MLHHHRRGRRSLAWLSLAAGLVACAGAPPEPTSQPPSPEVAMTSTYAQIKRLVLELRQAPALTPAAIERILGVTLAPANNNDAWSSVEGQPTAGPFAKVELRASKNGPWRLLNLDVRDGGDAFYPEFRGDLIPETIGPSFNPDIPPDGQMSFVLSDKNPKQDIHFGFGAKVQRLLGVSYHRDFE